jgi:hypothetical protein
MTRLAAGVAAAALLLGIGVAAAADAPGMCRQGDQLVGAGKSMCQNGFMTTCMGNGAWYVDRHEPCFKGGAVSASCQISKTEFAAPGARSCVQGRMRQCSDKGEWIDLIADCSK